MKQKIVDILYIIIIAMLIVLALYSLFFGINTTQLEDICVIGFGIILFVSVVTCVLLDKEDKDGNSGMDDSNS